MTDEFAKQIATSGKKDLTTQEQQQTGKPVAGDMDQGHKDFLQAVFKLIDDGTIDVNDPQTFLKQEIYEGLDQAWKDKTDLSLVNIANQLRLIDAFRQSSDAPDESPQLETMVEQLWQMKQRIEESHDVFIF